MRSKPTEIELRRTLVGDSMTRKKALDDLILIVREKERNRVLDTLAAAKAKAEPVR